MGETSAGQKQLASNSLYSPSHHPAAAILISKFTGTTKEWLKGGGTANAETNRQTLSSTMFTPSWAPSSLLSTLDMFQAKKTQPTNLLKAYTHPLHSFCPKFPSPQHYVNSSLTLTPKSVAWSQNPTSTAHHPFYPNPITCSLKTNVWPSTQSLIVAWRSSLPQTHKTTAEGRPWHAPLPPLPSKNRQRPTPYRKNLAPLPSPLQPHCPANQRLRLWCPLIPRAQHTTQLADEDLECIEAVMAHAWEVDMHATYASGLLSFMVFCDKKGIPEKDRAPASHVLLLSFVSTLAAAYSGSAISNYLYGIRAWHILHGIPWQIEKMEMDTLLKAAEKVTPPVLKAEKEAPLHH